MNLIDKLNTMAVKTSECAVASAVWAACAIRDAREVLRNPTDEEFDAVSDAIAVAENNIYAVSTSDARGLALKTWYFLTASDLGPQTEDDERAAASLIADCETLLVRLKEGV